MEEYIKYTAEMLKEKYCVWGSFYTLRYPGGAILGCRNGLEIFTINQTTHLLESALPDALFVMMNPGSSKPIEPDVDLSTYDLSTISKLTINMVETRPDPTQYQLMRLMMLLRWKYIRVINLSDIVETSSSSFLKELTRLRKLDKTAQKPGLDRNIHSVFSNARARELRRHLRGKESAPVILGWGSDNRLKTLATNAIKRLKEYRCNTIGMSKNSNDNSLLYRHPNMPNSPPKNADWLNFIIASI
ncbi:hypothetical protein [Desulfosporosinus sp. SB140]|uniref:hypothetical protein n=1 Tax=Desulfosporosinus paludis TaxID=3115649 RepID=UPI003890EFA8